MDLRNLTLTLTITLAVILVASFLLVFVEDNCRVIKNSID